MEEPTGEERDENLRTRLNSSAYEILDSDDEEEGENSEQKNKKKKLNKEEEEDTEKLDPSVSLSKLWSFAQYDVHWFFGGFLFLTFAAVANVFIPKFTGMIF